MMTLQLTTRGWLRCHILSIFITFNGATIDYIHIDTRKYLYSNVLASKSIDLSFVYKFVLFLGNVSTFTFQSPIQLVKSLLPWLTPQILIVRVDRTCRGVRKRRDSWVRVRWFLPQALLNQTVFGVQKLKQLIYACHCLQNWLVIGQLWSLEMKW